MTVHLVTDEKIAETSSKGNQEKWYDDKTCRWYKLDQFGYEALSETLVSAFLEKSGFEKESPFSFTRYRMEKLNVHNRERTGCSSLSFLKSGQSIITLSHLLGRLQTSSLKQKLESLPSDKKRIAYLADATAAFTGLKEFPRYLTLLFEIDALFLNDDRHLNNIAVLEKNGKYDYCPVFDNGAGLLSNTQLSPMDIAPKALIPALSARPFNTTFTRQMNTARSLYGQQLAMPVMTSDDISKALEPMLKYYAQRDRGIITDRVTACVLTRQRFL